MCVRSSRIYFKICNESEIVYTKSIDANGKSDYGIDTANCRTNDTKINNWIIKTQSSHEWMVGEEQQSDSRDSVRQQEARAEFM